MKNKKTPAKVDVIGTVNIDFLGSLYIYKGIVIGIFISYSLFLLYKFWSILLN